MVGLPVQYLNNRSHGQNLMSTPGQAKPTAQYFPKNPTTVGSPLYRVAEVRPKKIAAEMKTMKNVSF
jgi:hypothetical protein